MTLAHRVAIMNDGVLQQLGTPREVYDEPATLFVAGFMGSSPMNFISGSIESGQFQSSGVTIPVTGSTASNKAVLGFRPEDAEVTSSGNGLFDATVFTSEQTGEYTLVTVVLNEETMTIKMARDFDAKTDASVAVNFSRDKGFIFDAISGDRADAGLTQ